MMNKRLKRLIQQSSNKGDIPKDHNFFIAIVQDVVDKDSDILSKQYDSGDIKEYVDNRNIVYVTPIDTDYRTSVIPAFYLNSQYLDVPIKGEGVLCLLTHFGSVIIDRFSENAFSLNYDKIDSLLSGRAKKRSEDIFIDVESDDTEDKFNKETVFDVAPFYPKVGSKNFLGRNNQYLIFDHKARYEASDTEKRHTNDGNYIKIGFRFKGKQIDTREDSPLIILAQDAKLSKLLSVDYTSKNKLDTDVEPNKGIGMQSEEILFIGKRFTCLYSNKDMLLYAKNKVTIESKSFEIENNRTEVKSSDIKLGRNANSPLLLGDKFIESFSKDLIKIIENAQYLTMRGDQTIKASVKTKAQIQKFKAKYLNSSSQILSKNTKTK